MAKSMENSAPNCHVSGRVKKYSCDLLCKQTEDMPFIQEVSLFQMVLRHPNWTDQNWDMNRWRWGYVCPKCRSSRAFYCSKVNIILLQSPQSNMAMDNPPFMDDFPIIASILRDFQWCYVWWYRTWLCGSPRSAMRRRWNGSARGFHMSGRKNGCGPGRWECWSNWMDFWDVFFFGIRCHRLVIDVLFRLEPFLRPSLTTGTNWLPDE